MPLHALPAADRHRCSGLGPPRAGTLRITSGEGLVRFYDPGDGGFEKHFCSACGSALWSRDPADHSVISVRMGAFDGDPGVRPEYRQFVDDAAVWEPVPDDGLTRFPGPRTA